MCQYEEKMRLLAQAQDAKAKSVASEPKKRGCTPYNPLVDEVLPGHKEKSRRAFGDTIPLPDTAAVHAVMQHVNAGKTSFIYLCCACLLYRFKLPALPCHRSQYMCIMDGTMAALACHRWQYIFSYVMRDPKLPEVIRVWLVVDNSAARYTYMLNKLQSDKIKEIVDICEYQYQY